MGGDSELCRRSEELMPLAQGNNLLVFWMKQTCFFFFGGGGRGRLFLFWFLKGLVLIVWFLVAGFEFLPCKGRFWFGFSQFLDMLLFLFDLVCFFA